jgi:endo-1,4-beta-xylanase
MVTRRGFVTDGLKTAAALSATAVAPGLLVGCGHRIAPHVGLLGSLEDVKGSRSLRAHARKRGLISGSAVHVDKLQTDAQYARLLSEQCDILVPHVELKWVALRPARERFNFDAGDALVAFGERNHIKVRGHTLCWHESVPEWIKQPENAKDARSLFVGHIQAVCRHFAGRMHSWDVVNEAILPKDGRPDGLRKSFWFEQVGPDYIDLAFRTARAADPHALLTYNDYGVEYDSEEDATRRKLILDLLRGMKERGVPIDAVGIQSHIKAAQPYAIGKGLADYMESIRQMGLQIYLTELDVNEDDIKSDDVAVRDAEIAKTYRQFLDVALANPAVKLVLTWDISDRFTWLNNGPTHHRKQPNRPQRALPFDSDYRPKEAFFAMRDAYDARRV